MYLLLLSVVITIYRFCSQHIQFLYYMLFALSMIDSYIAHYTYYTIYVYIYIYEYLYRISIDR